MSFAHPENLVWLWAVLAIPLLYLLRRPAKTHPVPHLFLWERALHSRMPRKRRRLRDLIGLLLQILIASSLIVAWSGPRSETTVRQERPTLVVLDHSRSMAAEDGGGRSRLSLARSWLRDNYASLAASGPVSVVLAGERVSTMLPFGSDEAQVGAFLAQEISFDGELSAAALVSYASEVVAADDETDLVLLTDRSFPAAAESQLEEAGFRLILFDTAGGNAGFTSFEVGEAGLNGATFDTTLSCYGTGPLYGVVALRAGDELLYEEQMKVAGGEERKLTFEAELPPGVWLTLTWTCKDDRFPLDDVLEFWSPQRERLKVLVVSDDDNRFVKNALAALDSVFDLTAAAQTSSSQWRQAESYDLTILAGVRERKALPPGAYILLNSWAPNLPFREGLKVDEVEVVRQAKSDELLRGIDLRDLEVKTAFRLKGGRGFETLLEGTSGPLITRGGGSAVRFLHLAFDTDPQNSSLVLLPAFPLMIKDAARFLVPKPRRIIPGALTVGQAFAPHSLEPGSPSVVVEFMNEEGSSSDFVDLGSDRSGGSFRVPQRQGRARFYIGEIEEMCAINVCDPVESDVFTARPADRRAEPPEPRENVAFADRSGILYSLALLFLLLEWLCYTRSWTR